MDRYVISYGNTKCTVTLAVHPGVGAAIQVLVAAPGPSQRLQSESASVAQVLPLLAPLPCPHPKCGAWPAGFSPHLVEFLAAHSAFAQSEDTRRGMKGSIHQSINQSHRQVLSPANVSVKCTADQADVRIQAADPLDKIVHTPAAQSPPRDST